MEIFGLREKVAIVTGGTSGLGWSIAHKLASQGCYVIGTGRNSEAGKALVRSIQADGGRGSFITADIENQSEANSLVEEAVKRFNGIDIMVSCAGAPSAAQGLFGDVEPMDIANQVAKTIRIKLNPVHAVISHMQKRARGQILFVTSEGGRFPTPGQSTVALHSAGLIMANKVMAKELSRYQIRVNTLCVTMVENTPVHDRFANGEMTPIRMKIFNKIKAQAPFGLANPENVADSALFLLSDMASHITGTTLSVTGGATYT